MIRLLDEMLSVCVNMMMSEEEGGRWTMGIFIVMISPHVIVRRKFGG